LAIFKWDYPKKPAGFLGIYRGIRTLSTALAMHYSFQWSNYLRACGRYAHESSCLRKQPTPNL